MTLLDRPAVLRFASVESGVTSATSRLTKISVGILLHSTCCCCAASLRLILVLMLDDGFLSLGVFHFCVMMFFEYRQKTQLVYFI